MRQMLITVEEFKEALPESFCNKIKFAEPTECWEWQNSLDSRGYGQFKGDGKTRLSHRFVYVTMNRELPKEILVCHRCDNPLCNNPNHLFAGTHQDNRNDCVKKGRQSKGESHSKAKLTEDQIRTIRDRLSKGEHQRVIAKEYGVAHSGICNINKRKTWNHVV